MLSLLPGTLAYTLGITLVLTSALWPWRRAKTGRDIVALIPLIFFVVLTQYPLPDPATLTCTAGEFDPILRPFQTLEHFARLHRRDATLWEWMSHIVVVAAALNFFICFALGMGLTRFLIHWRTALMIGLGLSLTVETSQLSGMFWIYPCAFRQFEVDDLILNTAGVVVGFMVWRRIRRA